MPRTIGPPIVAIAHIETDVSSMAIGLPLGGPTATIRRQFPFPVRRPPAGRQQGGEVGAGDRATRRERASTGAVRAACADDATIQL
jgi:hypothetical protein